MMPRLRKKNNQDVEIAITNLVDVIFVLLIFFVLTTTFTKETGVDITRPGKGTASNQLASQPVFIAVTREGTLHINERQVDMAMLESILRREGATDPDKSVVIDADRQSDMGTIVEIHHKCHAAGLKKISVKTAENQ